MVPYRLPRTGWIISIFCLVRSEVFKIYIQPNLKAFESVQGYTEYGLFTEILFNVRKQNFKFYNIKVNQILVGPSREKGRIALIK